MTLLISSAHAGFAFLMADRRMTRWSGLPDDETNKLAVARFAGARFLVGFTGLAEVDGLPTSEWFVQAVARAGQSTRAAAPVLEEVGQRLEQDIAGMRIPARFARLSIAGIGFVDGDVDRVPAGWRLSNFQASETTLRDARTDVRLERYESQSEGDSWEPMHWFDGSGSDYLPRVRDEAGSFVDGVHRGAHPSLLAHHAFRVVTAVSKLDRFVGRQANAAYITPDGLARFRYFTTSPVAGTTLPVMVTLAEPMGPRLEYYGDVRQMGRFKGVGEIRPTLAPSPFLYSDESTEWPVQARAAPCLCGSGRKARHCHRRETNRWRDVPIFITVTPVYDESGRMHSFQVTTSGDTLRAGIDPNDLSDLVPIDVDDSTQ